MVQCLTITTKKTSWLVGISWTVAMVMGESRKHGAFSASRVQLSVESDGPHFDLLCIEDFYAEEASCDASFVLPFTLHLKDENEKGDLDYEQEIFRTGRIISQRENG